MITESCKVFKSKVIYKEVIYVLTVSTSSSSTTFLDIYRSTTSDKSTRLFADDTQVLIKFRSSEIGTVGVQIFFSVNQHRFCQTHSGGAMYISLIDF